VAEKMTVTVEMSAAGADALGARIDDEPLKFKDGKASRDVEAGIHFLQYFVLGPPGTTYRIAITSPAQSKWERKGAVPGDGLTAGSKKFVV